MATLNWQQASSDQGTPTASGGPQGLWFAVSLGLVGIIIGFTIGTWRGGSPSVAGANAAVRPSPSVPSAPPAQPPAPTPTGTLPAVNFATDHVRGNKDATIVVIEYSDFQCPFCKRVHPTIQQVLKDNPEDVAWVYRHYPLNFHPFAQILAEGSECAAELGGNDAFWKYADTVYGTVDFNSATSVKDQVLAIADDIGLSEQSFGTCLDSGKFAQKIKAQMDAGAAAGVTGTPGNFVVNLKTQKRVDVKGAQPLDAFVKAIESVR